jgi:hypothetical protein
VALPKYTSPVVQRVNKPLLGPYLEFANIYSQRDTNEFNKCAETHAETFQKVILIFLYNIRKAIGNRKTSDLQNFFFVFLCQF